MLIKNKLDKTFGPFGSSMGFFLIPGGAVATYFSPYGILIVLAGAFAAFTTTSTVIDTDNRRMRHCDNLFGIIRTGKWVDLRPGMKLGLKRAGRGFVGYIKGTQPVEIRTRDIRIYLFDERNKPLLPVNKYLSVEKAREGLKEMANQLGIDVI